MTSCADRETEQSVLRPHTHTHTWQIVGYRNSEYAGQGDLESTETTDDQRDAGGRAQDWDRNIGG